MGQLRSNSTIADGKKRRMKFIAASGVLVLMGMDVHDGFRRTGRFRTAARAR